MRRCIPAALALIALASPTVVASQELAVEVAEDIVYATVGDRDLKLDLARPAGASGSSPAIIAIHGGAWRSGDKADVRNLLVELAEAGYVAISPEYRFCPEHTFPAQIHDVKAADRWLKRHADEYGVDPDRVGAVGFSAGGHLALLLGLTDASDGLEGPDADESVDTGVRAVVNFFGPSDLAADDLPAVSIVLRNDLIGGTPEEKPDEVVAASPLTYIGEADAPILVFQGTADPLIPATQATALAEAMAEAGIPGRVELIIGAGHGVAGPDVPRTKRATIEFFDRFLKPEGDVPAYLRP